MAVTKKKEAPKTGGKTTLPATRTSTPPASVPAAQLPAFMQGRAGKGTENLNQGDYEMPRIKLIQGISEELTVYDGISAGDFFHNTAEESLGSSVKIVPLFISKRFVLWRPRPPVDQGGILARADDGVHWSPPNTEFTVKVDRAGKTVKWKTAETVTRSGLDAWGTFNPDDPSSPPAATLCYVVIVALPDRPELSPVALLLQRAAITPAKKFFGKLQVSQAPSYGMVFEMSSVLEDSPAGKYNAYRFTAAGLVEDEKIFKEFEALNESFSKTGIIIKDLENAQDDGPAAGGPVKEDKY